MSKTQSQQIFRIPIYGSTWFITGIGRGLGRAIAEQVLRRGGKVAGTVRRLADGEALQKQHPGQVWLGELEWGIEGFFESLAGEVAGFGIATTIVEPGAIRTDFGSSGVLSREIEAYRGGPVGALRGMAKNGYQAPGDPVKMAKAIVDTFEAGCLRIHQIGAHQQAAAGGGLPRHHDGDRLR